MAQVLVDMAMSLDGFAAGRDGHSIYPIEELRDTGGLHDLIDTTGAVVMGRGAYDMANGDFTGYEYQVPIFVLTHRPPETPARGLTFTFVTDGCESAVEKARAAAGDRRVVVIGGPSTAKQCLQAGLVDVFILRVVPVFLGAGLRLFDTLEPGSIILEACRQTHSSQIATLHLRMRP